MIHDSVKTQIAYSTLEVKYGWTFVPRPDDLDTPFFVAKVPYII